VNSPAPSRLKMSDIEQLRFLTPELAFEVEKTVGTPAYAYDYNALKAQVLSRCQSGCLISLIRARGSHARLGSPSSIVRPT
jgi:hypothetical protein